MVTCFPALPADGSMESIIGAGGVSSEQACNNKIEARKIILTLSANSSFINKAGEL